MSMSGPGGAAGVISERNAGGQSRSRSITRHSRTIWHRGRRIHAEEAAELGQPVEKKRPWWKFWGQG